LRLPGWDGDAETAPGIFADGELLWEHRVVSYELLDVVGRLAEVAPSEQVAALAAEIGAAVPAMLAVPLFEEAYRLRVEVLGDRHPDTLTSLNNLAGIYEAMGRLDDALPRC